MTTIAMAYLSLMLPLVALGAQPPGGVDTLSPHTLRAGPALASDIVWGGTVAGSLAVGAYGGAQRGDWRAMGATAGTLVVTAGLTELTKVLTDRRRPYTWDPSHPAAGVSDYCAGTRPVNPDDCKSFFSGHTALTAAASFSSVRTLQLEGGLPTARDRNVAYGSAALLTLTAASLRVIAGKHYVTDVSVGALLGTGIGLLGPRLVY